MKQNAEQAVLDIVEFNMMDIMKELADILGINDDELKEVFKNGTLKASYNGKPVIDVENGVDKLATKDESKKVCEKTHKKESNVSSTIDTPCTYDSQPCTCPKVKVTYDTWLNKDIFMVNPDAFIVLNEVDGHPLAPSPTEITFSHVTENGWVPGVTNKQLLAILCERFKEEPKKVEILKALMNS